MRRRVDAGLAREAVDGTARAALGPAVRASAAVARVGNTRVRAVTELGCAIANGSVDLQKIN